MDRLTLSAAILGSSFIVGMAFRQEGAQAEKSLKVQRLEILDDKGVSVIELAVDKGGPHFRMMDKKGNTKLAITLDDTESPSVTMSSPEGHALVVGTGKGQPSIMMTQGKSLRLAIASTPNGPGMVMMDKDGAPRVKLQIDESKSASQLILAPGGNKHAITIASAPEFATLHMRDSKGVTRISAACAEKQDPTISLQDDKETPRMMLLSRPGGAALTLQNDTGEPILGLAETERDVRLVLMQGGKDPGRLQMDVSKKGRSAFVLTRNQKDFPDFGLWSDENGPTMVFSDSGKNRMSFTARASESHIIGMEVLDKAGRKRIAVGAREDGTPVISALGEDGKPQKSGD